MSIVFTWKHSVDITADVMFDEATISITSGTGTNSFKLKVKDPDLTYDFKAGERLEVDIDGYRYFDGYMLDVRQTFAFPVIITTNDEQRVRIWELNGADASLLFKRRFVFNQTRPEESLVAFKLPAGTSDLSYLNLIMTHLTLQSDDLSTDFHEVGTPNPDVPGIPISIGDQWDQAMRWVAALPGAVWGMRPDRTVYYEDDLTITAPFAISDMPDDATSYGYSNFSWTDDGSRLVNDAKILGVGLGQNHVTYKHVYDQASINAHGFWPNPNPWRYDLYVPEHVQAVAESVVYGSPQHLHGAKDDAIMVRCRVRQPGLIAGQKVRIISTVFDQDIVLPIRNVEISFVNPNEALYDLTCTWDIDAPRTFHDWPPYPTIAGPRLEVLLPDICEDLFSNGFVAGDIIASSWATETSDPKLGLASISIGVDGATIRLQNRKRYNQTNSFFMLLLMNAHGDGYDGTSVWAQGIRGFQIPNVYSWGIKFQIRITGRPGFGSHYTPFPIYDFWAPPVERGTQPQIMIPQVNFMLNINSGTWSGTVTADTVFTIDYMVRSNGNVVITAYDTFGTTLPGNTFSGIPGVDQMFWDLPTTDALRGKVGVYADLRPYGLANDGGPKDHFFDNNFELGDQSDGYVINSGNAYSPDADDGASATISMQSTLYLYVDDLVATLPDCYDATPQIQAGEEICEQLVRIDSENYQTSRDFQIRSSRVQVDGIEQRLDIDYAESPPNHIVFRVPLDEPVDVSACYQGLA